MKKFDFLLSKTIILLIHIYLLFTMISQTMDFNSDIVRLSLLLIFIIYFAFSTIKVPKISLRRDILVTIYYVLIIVMYLIFYSKIDQYSIRDYLFFPFIYLVGTKIFRNNSQGLKKYMIKTSLVFFIVMGSIFLYALFYTNNSPGEIVNSVYYLLFLAPFLLGISDKKTKSFILVVLLILVFISGKRAAFLVLLVYFIIVYLVLNIRNKKTLGAIFHIFLIITITLFINLVVSLSFDIDFLGRLVGLIDDGGSGRFQLYTFFISEIKNLSIVEVFFGNGMIATSSISSVNSVHNDFLEVFFRLGLIGFSLYWIMVYNIINFTKFNLNKQDKVFAVTLFVVLTLFSQLIFVPTYIGYIALYFSMINRQQQYKGANVREYE